MKKFIGIDFSKNKAGVCIYSDNKIVEYKLFVNKNTISKKLSTKFDKIISVVQYSSMSDYADKISEYIIKNSDNASVIFEGYAFGAKSRAIEIAEAEGAVKYLLIKGGITDIIAIPVTRIRKLLGNGSFDKEEVYKLLPKKTQKELKKLNDFRFDVSDAFACAKSASLI